MITGDKGTLYRQTHDKDKVLLLAILLFLEKVSMMTDFGQDVSVRCYLLQIDYDLGLQIYNVEKVLFVRKRHGHELIFIMYLDEISSFKDGTCLTRLSGVIQASQAIGLWTKGSN